MDSWMISPTVTGFSLVREFPAWVSGIEVLNDDQRQEDAVEILSNSGTEFDLRR